MLFRRACSILLKDNVKSCRTNFIMPATVPLSNPNPSTRHLHIVPLPDGIPDTHREHSEATTTILVPKDAGAFLNPVQEFNRDLSVAVIRAWNEMRKEEFEGRWRARGKGRKGKMKEKKAAGPGEASELSSFRFFRD